MTRHNLAVRPILTGFQKIQTNVCIGPIRASIYNAPARLGQGPITALHHLYNNQALSRRKPNGTRIHGIRRCHRRRRPCRPIRSLPPEAKAADAGQEISVCVVEKGSEVGAHILSGAVFEPRALNELFPDWKELGAPLNTPVKRDDIYLLKTAEAASKLPNALVPKTMHNEGNYIISLGNLCRWLAQQAENLGVEIYPGFAAQEALIDENGIVRGIVTGDLGVDREGNPKEGMYTPGMELRAKYTLFAEGCRGHIGKQLINRFQLNANVDPQHYAIGIKELWDIDPAKHEQGLVVHTAGWPLNDENTGGSFLYHLENNQVVVGLIVDLSYSNPHLSPFDEFQRYKHHPVIKQYRRAANAFLRRPRHRQRWPELPAEDGLQRRRTDRLRRRYPELRQDQGQPHRDEVRHAGRRSCGGRAAGRSRRW